MKELEQRTRQLRMILYTTRDSLIDVVAMAVLMSSPAGTAADAQTPPPDAVLGAETLAPPAFEDIPKGSRNGPGEHFACPHEGQSPLDIRSDKPRLQASGSTGSLAAFAAVGGQTAPVGPVRHPVSPVLALPHLRRRSRSRVLTTISETRASQDNLFSRRSEQV